MFNICNTLIFNSLLEIQMHITEHPVLDTKLPIWYTFTAMVDYKSKDSNYCPTSVYYQPCHTILPHDQEQSHGTGVMCWVGRSVQTISQLSLSAVTICMFAPYWMEIFSVIFNTIQYNTVQYNTLQYSTIW